MYKNSRREMHIYALFRNDFIKKSVPKVTTISKMKVHTILTCRQTAEYNLCKVFNVIDYYPLIEE